MDTTNVPLLTGKRFGDEEVDQTGGLIDRVLASADRDEIGIVVLAGQERRRLAPYQRRARAPHLVRGHLLAVAGTTEDHTQASQSGGLIGHHGTGRRDAEGRIVVSWVVGDGTVIDDLMTARTKMLLNVRTEFKTGVIRRYVDAHVQKTGTPVCGAIAIERLVSFIVPTLAAVVSLAFRPRREQN